MDQILSRLGGGAVAFEWRQGGWEIIRWAAHNCSGERMKDGICVPFEANSSDSSWMLTAGYIVAMIMFLPMSLKNVSLWGTDWSDMFGVILFNFAVVIAVPAWLYERRPDVCVSSGTSSVVSLMKCKMLRLVHYVYV